MLLLDEPLSALDAKVRIHLRQELKKFHRRLGLTTIMVTHDQEEALSIADRIFVMNDGVMMQSGAPRDIYINPANAFVANFIGMTNFLDAQVVGPNSINIGGKRITVQCKDFLKGDEICVAARPEAIEILSKATKNSFEGKVVDMEFLGSFVRLHIKTSLSSNNYLLADTPMTENFDNSVSLNANINFALSPKLLNIFKNEAA